MKTLPFRQCVHSGCRVLTRNPGSRCDKHKSKSAPAKPRAADPFYWRVPWLNLRKWFLARNPICAECDRKGRVTAANEVHHLKPKADFPELALVAENLEALCKSCHSRLTRRENTPSGGI
jgi:5-methylcytosine-specific restriction protein A